MRRKWNPGCPCCEPDCGECGESYSDGGTTEQVAGDWTFGTGTAVTDDADALLIDEGEQPDGIVKFTAWFSATMTSSDLTTQFRCVFGWEDSSNYLYFESELVDIGFGNSGCQWTLHAVVAGVDTDTGYSFISGAVGLVASGQRFLVCVDPYEDDYGSTHRIVVLTAGVSFYSSAVRLDVLYDVPGTRNGYGTGTTVRNGMTFSWPIAAKSLQEISPGTVPGEGTVSRDCNCACPYNEWTEWPSEMQVEIVGVEDGDGCDNCDAFNATHVLDAVTACSYSMLVEDASCSQDIFANDPSIEVRFYSDTTDSYGYPIVKIEVKITAAPEGGGSTCYLIGSATLASSCGRAKGITDVQQLEITLTPTDWDNCCEGTAIAYVTGVA